jgi:hypothetical protein
MRTTLPPEVAGALSDVLPLIQHDPDAPAVAGVPVAFAEAVPAEASVAAVGQALYVRWYLGLATDDVASGAPDLSPLLRAVHAEASRFDPGWVVLSGDADGCLQVGRGEAVRSLRPGDYLSPMRPGVPPAPGEMVAVTGRYDWTDQQTGFWFAQRPTEGPGSPLARAYLNMRLDGIAAVIERVTGAMRDAEVAYTLKVPWRPEAFGRVDTLVVYHARPDGPRVEALLCALHPTIRGALDPRTPPLARRVADGLAVADDPGDGHSFGESRSHAIAPAAIALARMRPTSRDEAIARLSEGLRDAGIDPMRPWATPA